MFGPGKSLDLAFTAPPGFPVRHPVANHCPTRWAGDSHCTSGAAIWTWNLPTATTANRNGALHRS
jgi:hypothetical protein